MESFLILMPLFPCPSPLFTHSEYFDLYKALLIFLYVKYKFNLISYYAGQAILKIWEKSHQFCYWPLIRNPIFIVDTDECYELDNPCHASEICQNQQGAYTCVCDEGYVKTDGGCVRNNAGECF